MLDSLWEFLNSPAINFYASWGTIYYSLVFFVALSIFMVALRPIAELEKAFTWLIISISVVLIRVVAIRAAQRPFEFWGTLTWLNLAMAITYTGYVIWIDKMLRRDNLKLERDEAQDNGIFPMAEDKV